MPHSRDRVRILDLFSGAGGFSYGFEKNKNFKTVVATDFNEKAFETFKYNMPETFIIGGDITDKTTIRIIIDPIVKRIQIQGKTGSNFYIRIL